MRECTAPRMLSDGAIVNAYLLMITFRVWFFAIAVSGVD